MLLANNQFNTIQHNANTAPGANGQRDFVKHNINSAGYGFQVAKETFIHEVPIEMQLAYRDMQRNLQTASGSSRPRREINISNTGMPHSPTSHQGLPANSGAAQH